MRDLTGADAAVAARPHAGRTLDVALSSLLSPAARLNAAPTAHPAEEIVPELPERALLAARNGFALTAVVLEALPDGKYKVAVADAKLVLKLPAGLQAGELVFLRPKVAPGPALPPALAPVAQIATPAGNAVEMDFGTTAQLVARLATAVPETNAKGTSIVTQAPLSPEPGNAPRMAAGLRDAVATSGLFYESHLADWVDGSGSRHGLAREPQAALAQAAAGAVEAGGKPHALTPQAETLVQRQLDVFEHRTALWQGEAWPGQPAEVRISEEDPGSQGAAGGETLAWQASLRVTMRGLGNVEARIALAGRQARLAIVTGDPASAQRISTARGDLARALGEQGLTLAEATIDHGVPAKPR
jgi:hypothetical protein